MSTMEINIQLVAGGKPGEDGWTTYKIIELKKLKISGEKIADVKKAIKYKQDLPKDPEIFCNNNCLKDEDEASILTEGGSTVALFVKESGHDEAINVNVRGGNVNKWIVSGNNWSFETFQIEAGTLITVPIKLNSILHQEHKFAVIRKKPEDKKWRGVRYQLEERQCKDAEIQLRDDDTVSVSFISESGDQKDEILNPEKEKVYDEDEMESRKEKGKIILSVITLGVAIIALL